MLQFRHLRKVFTAIEILYQQAAQLIVSHHEVQSQQLLLFGVGQLLLCVIGHLLFQYFPDALALLQRGTDTQDG